MSRKFDELLEKLLESMIDEVNENHKKNKETEEEFKPHLEDPFGDSYGVIGEETNICDVNFKPLYVGDIVAIKNIKRNSYYGLTWVVNDKDEGFNILGAYEEKFVNGKSKRFEITLFKSYKDLKHNETLRELPIKAKLVKE